MGVYIWETNETHNLPSEYQEVEYIQLTGTQYISSFRFPVNFKFTIKAAFDATTTYYNVYDTQQVSPMLWVDTSGRFEMNINYKSSVFTKNTFITVVSDATGANNILTIDGTQVISGTKVSTITQDTFLLHRGASDGFKGKIAYMSLEDENTKVFELIPCYRKSDDVIGMYDLVNDVFYTNSGTGTFTKGEDVNVYMEKELKNAYIGEYRVPGANTLFYASLNGNTNSEGTLNPTFNSQSGTITYPTTGNIQYAYLNSGVLSWNISNAPTNIITFQARVKGYGTGGVVAIGALSWSSSSVGIELLIDETHGYVYTQYGNSWYGLGDNNLSNDWHLLTGVKDGTTIYLYIDGGLIGSTSCASSFNNHNYIYIGNNGSSPVSNVKMEVSNIILEDKIRTSQEISNYYNLTKANYGL